MMHLLLPWVLMMVGPVMLLCAYFLRHARRDFWMLLACGLIATFSLTASYLPPHLRGLMPVRVSTFAFYAAGALLVVWAAFTRLGWVARLLYVLSGIAFLSPLLFVTAFAVSSHLHGA